jgi:hypothetical protein
MYQAIAAKPLTGEIVHPICSPFKGQSLWADVVGDIVKKDAQACQAGMNEDRED